MYLPKWGSLVPTHQASYSWVLRHVEMEISGQLHDSPCRGAVVPMVPRGATYIDL